MGDSLIWVHGVHNMTFGADYRRQQINRHSDPNARGQFTFTGASTANLVNGVAAAGTGFDFASFLLGRQDTSALRYGNANLYFRTATYDVYMTDDWRLSQKFSINFGLRWDYGTPITELYNRLVNLDVAPGYARHRAGAARTIRPVLRRAAHFAGQAGQEQHLAAHRLRVAPDSQEVHGGSRRLRHLLQHLGVQHHRQQHGAAAALRADAEHRQFARPIR